MTCGVTFTFGGLRIRPTAEVLDHDMTPIPGLYAAGEMVQLSYNAQIVSDDRGKPQSARFRAFRSDPEGGLLGPLDATQF